MTNVRILPNSEQQADLEMIRAIATVMDEAVTFPGTRISVGLDALLGLIPGVGDLGSAAIGAYLLRAAQRLGVPAIVQVRMLMNLAFDALLGLVPFVGDLLDILFKANVRNANLVLRSVEKGEDLGRSSWLMVVGVFLAFIVIVVGGLIGTIFLVKWAWNAAG
jgi:hypothetical protein